MIFNRPELGLKRLDKILEGLHEKNRINEATANNAKQQYIALVQEAQSQWKDKFDNFSCDVGLDEFFYTILGKNEKYASLWSVMKICFIISHGNAAVEGEFSINKQLIVENLLEESLVAQRIIHDRIQNMGDVEEVVITRNMLTCVKNSRKKYQHYLDRKKELRVEEEKRENLKRKADQELHELEEMQKKIKYEREKEDVELEKKKKMLKKLRQGF